MLQIVYERDVADSAQCTLPGGVSLQISIMAGLLDVSGQKNYHGNNDIVEICDVLSVRKPAIRWKINLSEL